MRIDNKVRRLEKARLEKGWSVGQEAFYKDEGKGFNAVTCITTINTAAGTRGQY